MCDWTQGSDSPLSNDKKTEWANYRTSLRDITNTYKSVNANGFSAKQNLEPSIIEIDGTKYNRNKFSRR